MVAAMAAMLVIALAVPGAFGEDAVLFAVAYLVVRLLFCSCTHSRGSATRSCSAPSRASRRPACWRPRLMIVAGFLDGDVRVVLWIAALAVDYGGALIGRGAGWRVSPAHFAERYGLIVIIALGESIVSIGIGATGVTLTAGVVTAAVLGVVSSPPSGGPTSTSTR